MPVVTAFIDELREVFGRAEVDAVIRDGLKPGAPPMLQVWACEGGQTIGRPAVDLGTAVSVADMGLGERVRLPAPAPSERRR